MSNLLKVLLPKVNQTKGPEEVTAVQDPARVVHHDVPSWLLGKNSSHLLVKTKEG